MYSLKQLIRKRIAGNKTQSTQFVAQFFHPTNKNKEIRVFSSIHHITSLTESLTPHLWRSPYFRGQRSQPVNKIAYLLRIGKHASNTRFAHSDVPAPAKLLPTNVSMFPLVLGVLVGLAVLILLILLLIALGYRTRRQRAAYARRKALSDQVTTETTFSEADKIQQQQQIQQHQSVPSLTQQASSANSYGYQQSSDSGAGGGIASTYLSHAMFATEACWPAGLQPVPPGSNYFNDETPGVAFPPLGRDSGSHGYVQLPVSTVRQLAVIIIPGKLSATRSRLT